MLSVLPLLTALPLTAAPVADEPDLPAIEAEAWLNHIGQTPSLEALRGRPILIEAWATW